MMRSFAFMALLAAVSSATAQPAKPNVVFILADDKDDTLRVSLFYLVFSGYNSLSIWVNQGALGAINYILLSSP